ncbi:uncharacterized protein LOC122133247 [Clupea harengus]|uniref:Uncharacterized protein LOC122133247 n=1 Tax=Clupea harengus TaxID=7950 RepID=A0A8M1KLL9_CLUHA|nr:uncharacterized protein LOC122133247 [Clupea harengus]
MRFTFRSDDHMVITIPLGSLRAIREGQLMPDRFNCVFKDVYKVFLRGEPKALGVSQLVAGVFIICLEVLLHHEMGPGQWVGLMKPPLYTLASTLFIISGILSYVAGHIPHMAIMKLSFACNIVCIFGALSGVTLCGLTESVTKGQDLSHAIGLKAVMGTLLVGEMLVAIVMVYWESKAVCRDYFNMLPSITLKQEP